MDHTPGWRRKSSRKTKILIKIAALSLLIMESSSSGAQDIKPLATIVQDGAHARLGELIGAELRALGLATTTRNFTSDSDDETAQSGTNNRSRITVYVRIVPVRSSIEVRATDAEKNLTVQRDRPFEASTERDLNQVALETAELVRASLLELHTAPRPKKKASVPPQTSEPSETADERPEQLETKQSWLFSMEALLTITIGTFETAPLLHLAVGAHLRLVGVLGIELLGHIPIRNYENTYDEGTVTLTTGILGGGARFTFDTGLPWLYPLLGIGACWHIAFVEGRANSNFQGDNQRIDAVVPYVRLALAFSVAKRIRLRIGLLSGFSSSEVVVRVDEREILQWGKFLLWGEVGLDVAIF